MRAADCMFSSLSLIFPPSTASSLAGAGSDVCAGDTFEFCGESSHFISGAMDNSELAIDSSKDSDA